MSYEEIASYESVFNDIKRVLEQMCIRDRV